MLAGYPDRVLDALERLDPGKAIASVLLTPRCDLACGFCAAELDFDTMTAEEARGLLRALAGCGIRNFVLGGGEPFLWPHDLPGLARFAHDELGAFVQACTNGVALPEGFERIRAIDRFILPVESADPTRHDALRRGRPGHLALVRERMRRLACAGRELTVSTVVTRESVDDLPGVAALLVEEARAGVAIHAWHLYRFVPAGRGGARHDGRFAIERDAFVRACDAMKRLRLGFRVFRRDDMLRPSRTEFFWLEGGRLRLGSDRTAPAPPHPGG